MGPPMVQYESQSKASFFYNPETHAVELVAKMCQIPFNQVMAVTAVNFCSGCSGCNGCNGCGGCSGCSGCGGAIRERVDGMICQAAS